MKSTSIWLCAPGPQVYLLKGAAREELGWQFEQSRQGENISQSTVAKITNMQINFNLNLNLYFSYSGRVMPNRCPFGNYHLAENRFLTDR